MRWRHRSAARVVGTAVVVLALSATAACGNGTDAQWRSPGETESSAPKLPAALTFAQAADAANVSPAEVVSVAVSNGRLDTVSFVNGNGEELPGTFDAEKKTWKNATPLVYGMVYRVTANSTGDDGKSLQDSPSASCGHIQETREAR